MKILFVIVAIILVNIGVTAQNESDAANVAVKTADSVKEVKVAPKNPKIELPPEKSKPISVIKIEATAGITIDGRPDEDAWKNAVVMKDFYQTFPGDNIAPSKPTEVMLMYDEKNLYVAFKCWDEKDKIRATVAKRDEVFGEDNVRMWLDTYNDQRRAYVLGFNPFGIQQDGIYTEGRGADFSVDIVMESKGVIEDWGWSVEVKIPFKSLRYTAGKGKFWGFNAARNIDRFNDEFNQWLPDDRNISGFLIKHGKITGLDEIKYERTLEIVPSITVSETGSRVQANEIAAGRFVNQPIKQDIGLTLKYTLSPNITLDAAINPDFAEIEADAPVITANQRFPIFFQEKRPFFLEGQDTFTTPFQIFHSRQIVDPDVAAKLTGKIGKTSFGFLAASDNAPGNYSENEINNPTTFRRINEFVDRNATFGVLRIKRDFGKENNIGVMATYRSFPEQKNLVASIDGILKLSPRMVSQFQFIGTHTRDCFFESKFDPVLDPAQAQRNRDVCGTGRDPDDPNDISTTPGTYENYRTGNGLAYYWNLDYTTKNHGWFLEVGGRSKDYRADSGFTRRTNTNFVFFMNRFSTNAKPKAAIIEKSWRQFASVNYDWTGRLQDLNFGTNVNLNLQRTTFLNIETGVSNERIYEDEFGLARSATRHGEFFGADHRSVWQHYLSGNLNTTPVKKVSMGLFLGTIYNSYDFDFGAGRMPRVSPSFIGGDGRLDPGPGRQWDAELFVEIKPINPWRASLTYRKSRLTRNDTGGEAFDTNLFTVRSTYQFTRFIFTRLRYDYDTLSRRAGGQLLFGWNPSPGKAFYVGYNDNANLGGFNPFTGSHEPGFARNSRTFFIRASYLFRKSF
jgi:hypothetical protein